MGFVYQGKEDSFGPTYLVRTRVGQNDLVTVGGLAGPSDWVIVHGVVVVGQHVVGIVENYVGTVGGLTGVLCLVSDTVGLNCAVK